MKYPPRISLTHAHAWLGAEIQPPTWCVPGVFLAMQLLSETKATMYSNSTHRSNRCKRCQEIGDIVSMERHRIWLERQEHANS
jgi:hypothetical protein